MIVTLPNRPTPAQLQRSRDALARQTEAEVVRKHKELAALQKWARDSLRAAQRELFD